MLELREAGMRQVTTPRAQVMVSAVALAVPTFLVLAMRIRAEQHTRGFQCGMQLSQYARQFLRRHMEQRRVGEDAVKTLTWKVKRREVLLPNDAPGVGTRHGNKGGRSV